MAKCPVSLYSCKNTYFIAPEWITFQEAREYLLNFQEYQESPQVPQNSQALSLFLSTDSTLTSTYY